MVHSDDDDTITQTAALDAVSDSTPPLCPDCGEDMHQRDGTPPPYPELTPEVLHPGDGISAEPATVAEALVLYDHTQSAWDRRQVYQLGQVMNVFKYWAAHWTHADAEIIHRGAVILRAEKHAPEVERVYGVRLDPAGVGAYLELTAGTPNTVAAKVKTARKRPATPRRKAVSKARGRAS